MCPLAVGLRPSRTAAVSWPKVFSAKVSSNIARPGCLPPPSPLPHMGFRVRRRCVHAQIGMNMTPPVRSTFRRRRGQPGRAERAVPHGPRCGIPNSTSPTPDAAHREKSTRRDRPKSGPKDRVPGTACAERCAASDHQCSAWGLSCHPPHQDGPHAPSPIRTSGHRAFPISRHPAVPAIDATPQPEAEHCSTLTGGQ